MEKKMETPIKGSYKDYRREQSGPRVFFANARLGAHWRHFRA